MAGRCYKDDTDLVCRICHKPAAAVFTIVDALPRIAVRRGTVCPFAEPDLPGGVSYYLHLRK